MNSKYSRDLIKAMRLLTGFDSDPRPVCNKKAVFAEFGKERGDILINQIDQITSDFYLIADSCGEANGIQAAKCAVDSMRQSDHLVPLEILQMLEWCYSFDNR